VNNLYVVAVTKLGGTFGLHLGRELITLAEPTPTLHSFSSSVTDLSTFANHILERLTKNLSRTISWLYMSSLMVSGFINSLQQTPLTVLTEINDFGYPQNSEIDTLKTYITTESIVSSEYAAVSLTRT